MSDNNHAAMCVYCGDSIIYDTREVTNMAAAHAQIVEHDQQCTKNPLVALIAELEEREAALAAQFVALQDAATDLIHASNEEEAGDAMDRIGDCSEKQARELLALRQTDVLERLARLLRETHFDKAPSVARVAMQVNDAINRVKQEVRPLRLVSQSQSQSNSDPHPDCELECGAYGTYCKCNAEQC